MWTCKMKLYFLRHLPSAFWWKIHIKKASPDSCEVLLPYSWRSKNPFRSIYFAAQCGAAELSTGMLAILALKDQPSMAMLVTDIRTVFTKKASKNTTFTCKQGAEVREVVQKAIQTGEPQTITMISIGTMSDGTVVSETHLTWSFKVRS